MVKYITFTIGFFLFGVAVKAQQPDPRAVFISHKIAKKMADSLRLTAEQRVQIHQVNMQLHDQKELIRQQTTIPDSLEVRFQRIEDTRDSLYLPVIGAGKFPVYLEKKKSLVTNN